MNPDVTPQSIQPTPDSPVPPHFHKFDRISEKDIIPDGDTIAVIPTFPAPEGTEVSYFNNATFKRYKMISGVWHEIGSGGMGLIHRTANSGFLNSVSATIDLNADGGMYKVFGRAYTTPGSEYSLGMTFNNDTSSKYYGKVYNPALGAVNYNPDSRIWITAGATEPVNVQWEALITNRGNGYAQVTMHSTAAGVTTKLPDFETSGWSYATSNITSIQFFVMPPSTNTYSWEIRIYKLITT